MKDLSLQIKVAKGDIIADTVIKNAKFLDVFNGEFVDGNVAIFQNKIVGIKDNYKGKNIIDAKGQYLVPGFIDSHLHIESSFLTPNQFERAVLPCGTTTII